MNRTFVLRAHTEILDKSERKKSRKQNTPERKWPPCAIVFDCETRTDEKQNLTFAPYRVVLADENGQYTNVRQEGFFYDPKELSLPELDELTKFAKRNKAETSGDVSDELQVVTLETFLKEIFLPLAHNSALIVGFNLPFDISRLVTDAREARRLNDDWSFVMLDEPFCPRIVVTRKDGKIAFFRLSGVGRDPKTGKKIRIPRGRFLDVRTLAWALRNVSYSLKGLCAALKIPGKLEHKPTGRVTQTEIRYARQDVRATLGSLDALRAEFERYPIDLYPDHAFSPASIAKAYFKKMGLIPPLKKFRLSPRIQGIAAQAFYGGRAECRVRHTPVPVVHTDFKSEYPTVIVLMGLWRLLTAKRLRIELATKDVRDLFGRVRLESGFKPQFWHDLSCFALVEPDGDVLPIRTEYSDSGENNVGVNILTSEKPIWYALPDLVASKLQTGKAPKIVSAFRVIPEGRQPGLQPTTLGGTQFDPRTGDFFKLVIETRERLKRDKRLSEAEREALGYFLKIMANAGYGIFIETTPKLVAAGTKLKVFSGESSFPTTSSVVEDKGPWYCPSIASLITSGGRLLLAMLECAVRERGGTYVFADTDSMAIVSTKEGGPVSCIAPEAKSTVTALSWTQVPEIAARFNRLNPYERSAVPDILKIEDVNFANGVQREIWCYSISAKRYTFFTQMNSDVLIVKPSEHGLGQLFVPGSEFDKEVEARDWIADVWRYLVGRSLGIELPKPKSFKLPAMMKFAITTPEVFKVLQKRQLEKALSYRERIKPFNFILCPMINRQVFGFDSESSETIRLGYPLTVDHDSFTLIAPFTDDASRWYKIPYLNIHDGKWFYLAPLEKKESFEASPYTLDDVVALYHTHPESKSSAPDGTPCGWHTAGLLQRTSIVVSGFDYIGKETDRKWEQEEDLSMVFPTLPAYRPNESARLVSPATLDEDIHTMSIREIAKRTGLSTRTVRAARKGKRIRKTTILKIENALREREMEELESEDKLEPLTS